MKTLRTIASLIALAAVACGETPDDPDQITPIGQVRGTISNPNSLAVGGDLRTAVVWYTFDKEKLSTFAVAQGVAVAPTLPAGFELTLTDPPPPEAFMVVEQDGGTHGSLRGAFGRLVAYEDLNGNGQLDVVKQGDAAYLDRIVGEIGGAEQFNAVVWIEPEDVDQAQSFVGPAGDYKPKAGYNLLIDVQGDGNEARWASIDTPLNLVLGDSTEAQLYMCADGTHEYISGEPAPIPGGLMPEGPGPNGVWPDPGDPNLTCHVAVASPSPAGEDPVAIESYAYRSCTVNAQVCVIQEDCVTSYWRKPSDPAKAAGWPCTDDGGSGGSGGDDPVETGGGQAGSGQTFDESGHSDP